MAIPPPNVDTSTGVDHPITRDANTGFFGLTFTTEQRARVNLENLLRTIKGERPFQPLFGSDLHALLFDNNVDDIGPLLVDAVVEATEIWLPEVIINSVTVERDNTQIDINRVVLIISFSVRSIPGSIQELPLPFEQPIAA